MTSLLKITSIIGALVFSSTTMAESNEMTHYREQATSLFQQLKNKNPDKLETKSKALLEISKGIVKSNIKILPQCQEYLTALLNDADKIALLPLAEIESGYHADGKLPPLKDGTCYHAKDLLVHPATVQAMAKQGINTKEEWKQAAHEIEEVLEHLSIVETVLAKK